MIAATFNSEAVYLLPYHPLSLGAATFEANTTGERAKAGPEGRKALRQTLITRYSFRLCIDGDEEKQFRTALRGLENKRVLCPFWPAARPAEEATSAHWASTGIWLTLELDLSNYEIHTGSSPSGFTPSAYAWRVPVMLGVFESEPDPEPMGGGLAECDIRFTETGDAVYALRAKAVTYSDGPTIAGRTPKLFPVSSNWALAQKHGRASVEIDREEQGYTRQPAESYEPQTPERVLELGVSTFDSDGCASLLGFFHARQGNVDTFWVEGHSDEVTLASATSAGSAIVSLESVAHLADTRFIAFVREGQASVLREIISIDEGADAVTLNSSPGTIELGTCRVVALILARFSSSRLAMEFTSLAIADAQVSVREVATEYETPSGETYGETFGALARTAQVYRFILKYPGGDVVSRYTSYERTIDAAGEIFTPLVGLTHKSITVSVEPDKSSVSFSALVPSTGPLAKLSPYRLEVPLWVEILDCEPDSSGASDAAVHRFIGSVSSVRAEKPWIEFTAKHLLADLQEEVPSLLMQAGDNHELYSEENGLDEADWTFTANVVSVSTAGASITINTLARGAGVPTIDDGYFGYGCVWKGSGSSYQSRTIINSTALSGGQLVINLAQPFDGSVTGSLSLSPGYSGEIDEMETKFAARVRHGGFAFVPVGNPSLIPIKQDTQQGKK